MPTQVATTPGSQGEYVLYPSNANHAAYLWDGSIAFLVSEGSTVKLYRLADPATPTAATLVKDFGALGGSGENDALYVADDGVGGTEVWVGIAENGSSGGAWVAHGVYDSSSAWTWDTTTSCVADGIGTGGGYNQISVVWTGTYLIVAMRAESPGGGNIRVGLNYTATKNGTGGWLTSVLTLSSTFGGLNSHYYASLHRCPALGCTVAIYSIPGDKLCSRVLPDSSSPALANWGAEADLGVGNNLNITDFQGAAALCDGSRMHVAYYDGSGNNKSIGYVTGSISVSGTSSAVTWDSPLAVGTQSVNNDSPALAIDGSGTVFVFWTNHSTGFNADIYYATVASPYTSASAETNLTNNLSGNNHHPAVPRLGRLPGNYVPLFYIAGSGSPYSIYYDKSIVAASGAGGSSISGAASLAADGTVSAIGVVRYAGAASLPAAAPLSAGGVVRYGAAASLSVTGSLLASAALLYAGRSTLAADAVLLASVGGLLQGAARLAVDAALTGSGVRRLRGTLAALSGEADLAAAAQRLARAGAALAVTGTLTARAQALLVASALFQSPASLRATALDENVNYRSPSGVITLLAALTAALILQPSPEGTVQ